MAENYLFRQKYPQKYSHICKRAGQWLEICDLFDFFGHQGGRKGCLNFYYHIDL